MIVGGCPRASLGRVPGLFDLAVLAGPGVTFFGVAHDATLGGVEQHGLLEVEDDVVILLAEKAYEIAVVLGGRWTFSSGFA